MDRNECVRQLLNVPEELRALEQWVLYRKEERNGKVTKVPYAPVGKWRWAKSNTPTDWASFELCCKLFVAGAGHGLGFMFSEYDPYCGIDFDHCVVDGKFDSAKTEIIRGLDSYSELSQSGRGVHVFVKASVSAGRKSTEHGIEIYDRTRFFAMTGKRLAVSHEIEERQTEVDTLIEKYFPKPVQPAVVAVSSVKPTLSDQDIIAKMTGNNHKADKLWRGDLSAYGGDHSSADFALANHLAYWTGNDINWMDRLFRQWALFRPAKWDRKATQGLTYGQLTMTKAMCRATYKG
jgi:putative DNA primase/helicase